MTALNLYGELFYDFFDPEAHLPWTCDPATMRDGGSLCQDYVCFYFLLLDTNLTNHKYRTDGRLLFSLLICY